MADEQDEVHRRLPKAILTVLRTVKKAGNGRPCGREPAVRPVGNPGLPSFYVRPCGNPGLRGFICFRFPASLALGVD